MLGDQQHCDEAKEKGVYFILKRYRLTLVDGPDKNFFAALQYKCHQEPAPGKNSRSRSRLNTDRLRNTAFPGGVGLV